MDISLSVLASHELDMDISPSVVDSYRFDMVKFLIVVVLWC